MNILITSVGTSTSVNLIKYFKKMGDVVIGTDIYDYGMTAGSILADKFVKVPLAVDKEYLLCITKIISEEKVELFIPINDEEILVVSKQVDRIKCNILIPDYDTINVLHDKLLCCNYMKEIGINVPNVLNDDNYNIFRVLRDRVGVGSKGIEFIMLGQECHSYKEDKFLQERIFGKEYTIDVLSDRDGVPLYIIPRERLEVKSGVATKVKIVKDDDLISATKTILQNFKLPGFSNVQFIKDENGKCWFIEVNYRFSGCGAATLATSEHYLEKYKKCISETNREYLLNEDTKWGAIVTRYYEEMVYESGIH